MLHPRKTNGFLFLLDVPFSFQRMQISILVANFSLLDTVTTDLVSAGWKGFVVVYDLTNDLTDDSILKSERSKRQQKASVCKLWE